MIVISIFLVFVGLTFMVQGKSIGDSDFDGIPDDKDKCPNSLFGEKIDKNGCDAFQFCKQFSCGTSCYYADFKNDEDGLAYDCSVVIVTKEGKYYPKCVPLNEHCGSKIPFMKVPEVNVSMIAVTGSESFFVTTLSGVPAGFGEINNSAYLSWCVDQVNYINTGQLYSARLYSSYDPDLGAKCAHCVDPDWPKVNYIINNKQGSSDDVQDAIWFFVNGGHWPIDPDAQAMINEANLFGQDFSPKKGQFMAIIVDIGNRNQLTIIEVDP
jgi:hypothetical protein